MTLDDAQRTKVAGWIAEGLKLSDIQSRLASEFKLTLTYMDVRLLVDDLKLTPKDPEPPAVPIPPLPAATSTIPLPKQPTPEQPEPAAAATPGVGGRVTVAVDKLARPGALVSGKVTFSDGNQAEWHLDQTGRLGLVPQKTGYRPPASDVDQFRSALEAELAKLGL